MSRLMLAALLMSPALIAGGAQAQSAPKLNLALPELAGAAPAGVVTAAGVPAKPVPDVEDALDPQARPKLQPQTLDSVVFAKTAVDHRFGSSGATASAGLLCGRMPGHADSGMAGAYGVDPHGRFVGAKLSFAF